MYHKIARLSQNWTFSAKMAQLSINGIFITKLHIYPKMAHLAQNWTFN